MSKYFKKSCLKILCIILLVIVIYRGAENIASNIFGINLDYIASWIGFVFGLPLFIYFLFKKPKHT